jgi:HAE1 family hydrophobic/amphiphilic exporter-1
MGISFIPAADYGEIFLKLELPPGSTLEESMNCADTADRYIREKVPELSSLIFFVGMENDLTAESRKRENIWGQLLLKNRTRKDRDFIEIISFLNRSIPEKLPGVSVTVLNGGFDRLLALGTDGAGYRVELSSGSWEDLIKAASEVEKFLSYDPEIVNTERDVTENRKHITGRLDGTEMGLFGVNPSEAQMTARIVFNGENAGELRNSKNDNLKIRLTTNLEGKTPDSSALSRIPVHTYSGGIITMDSFISIQEDTGVSSIRRRNRTRTITITGYPDTENIRGISQRLKKYIEENPLPADVDWHIKGISGLIGDSISKLSLILIISLFLVYAVMAVQFERLVQPLIIMASVPFSFIGVVAGLAVFSSDISLISFLGIIALAGIVVNNAIVQVDRINQLRSSGIKLEDAIVLGASARLKPILMTTLTTFFGVLPLAFAKGSGARIYAPLGQAIAGGLTTSTLVTLFLIPNLYNLAEKRKERKNSVKQNTGKIKNDSSNGAA